MVGDIFTQSLVKINSSSWRHGIGVLPDAVLSHFLMIYRVLVTEEGHAVGPSFVFAISNWRQRRCRDTETTHVMTQSAARGLMHSDSQEERAEAVL